MNTTITLIGDWHGYAGQARRVLTHPTTQSTDIFLHLGDFGIWSPHPPVTPKYLAQIQKALESHPSPQTPNLFFIDGNHESFSYLYEFPLVPSPYDTPENPQPYVRQMRPYAPNVYHLPRGTVHNFGTPLNFLAFGGAYSIDQAQRIPLQSYWPQEIPSLQEYQKALYATPDPSNPNQKIDIMLTHDTPILPPHVINRRLQDRPHSFRFYGRNHVLASDAFGPSMLAPLLRRHAPRYLFYGHNHEKLYSTYTSPDGSFTELVGLDEGAAQPIHHHIHTIKINHDTKEIEHL